MLGWALPLGAGVKQAGVLFTSGRGVVRVSATGSHSEGPVAEMRDPERIPLRKSLNVGILGAKRTAWRGFSKFRTRVRRHYADICSGTNVRLAQECHSGVILHIGLCGRRAKRAGIDSELMPCGAVRSMLL